MLAMMAQLQIQVGLQRQVHEHMQRRVHEHARKSGCMHTHRGNAGHEGTAANLNGIAGVASSGAGYRTSSTEVCVVWHKCRCRCGVCGDVCARMMGADDRRVPAGWRGWLDVAYLSFLCLWGHGDTQ